MVFCIRFPLASHEDVLPNPTILWLCLWACFPAFAPKVRSSSSSNRTCQCRARIDLTASTSYQRLLVHRCSSYYKLSPETDPTTKVISVYYRSESRM